MKVLMIARLFPPVYSGAGAQALALAGALARLHHDVTLVAAMTRGAERRTRIDGIAVHRLGSRHHSQLGRIYYYACLAWYLLWNIRRFEVVHVHGVFWSATVAAYFARRAGLPLLVKLSRDGDDDVATLDAARGRGLVGAGRYYPLSVAHKVISVNRRMEADARRLLGSERSVFIPNGVDTSWFRPPTVQERQRARARFSCAGRPLLVFPGGYIAHKGLDKLVACLDDSTAPDGVVVAIAGEVDSANPEVDSGLRDLVTSRSTKDARVTFLEVGLLGRPAMRELYWASDALVLLSQREGLPNVILEAMACGVFCVGSAIPGIADLGAPGEALEVVEAADEVSVRRALSRACTSGSPDAGASGPEFIRQNHSMPTLALVYSTLYRQCSRGSVPTATQRG